MFYYKNNFGNMKNILQCLFIYNTIIIDDMSDYINRISNDTLNKELSMTRAGGHVCILFYENSTKYIKNEKNASIKITKFPQDQSIKKINNFIEINASGGGYNYILYFNNEIDSNLLQTSILDNIIDPIIETKKIK